MGIILWVIVAILVAIVVWLAMQPGNFEVVRRRVVQLKPEEIYPIVADLKQWDSWSPWLMHEPDATLKYGDITDKAGGWYSWEGKYIGAGKMTHTSLTVNEAIEQELHFTKPMKSRNHVYWRFNTVGDSTEVTWGMRGKMPFVFRWMSNMMDQWVGKDFEIGLSRLAMVAGDMSDPMSIEFTGQLTSEPEDYIAKHFVGSMKDLPAAMREGFPEVKAVIDEKGMQIAGTPMAIYHTFEMKTGKVICDIAVPVVDAQSVDGFISGALFGQSYLRTTAKGEYSNLEKAWHSAFGHARMFKRKIDMTKPMVERYASDPETNNGLDVVTYIDLPLK